VTGCGPDFGFSSFWFGLASFSPVNLCSNPSMASDLQSPSDHNDNQKCGSLSAQSLQALSNWLVPLNYRRKHGPNQGGN
jgi:hypothetical protein